MATIRSQMAASSPGPTVIRAGYGEQRRYAEAG